MSDLPQKLYDEAQQWEGGRPFGLLVRAGDHIADLERQLEDIKVLVDGVDWFSPESLAETLRWIETTQRRTDDVRY